VKGHIKKNDLLECVNFLGEYGRVDAPGIFSSSDILLHLQPFDPCPTVVIEAMASGLVVIGPNNGGIPELVGEELSRQLVENLTNYSKYEWGNPENYALKIISLIPILDELKSKARCRAVEHFDTAKWIDYHKHLFGYQ
jgi:glycosyltransferase involved in cell wall biosynthesis